jgi:hypothetical protein
MDLFAKYSLLVLLMPPFAALTTDTLGRTRDRMITVVVATSVILWLVVFAAGDLGRRPNVADLYVWAYEAWPVLVLVAKGFNPALSWRSICFSIPVMSWHLLNLSILLRGEGGLGAAAVLFVGWFFMIVPFALLSGIFIGGKTVIRRIRGESFSWD